MNQKTRSLGSVLRLLVPFALAAGAATLTQASQTRWWSLSTQDELAKGELKGVSVTSDGKLVPAPALDEVFDTGEAFIYSALLDRRRNLYLGSGNNGKIFRIAADGQGSEYAKLADAGIFALATDSLDRLHAATSPDGKVFRFDSSAAPQAFFDPGQKYIWSLAMDGSNNLYVGTGPRGRIYKVDTQGMGEVFYDSSEAHIMTLQWDLDGNLLAGTSPKGLLLRITPAGRPSVVHDSPLAEIKAITIDRYGNIFAAALASASSPETAPAPPDGNPSSKDEGSSEARVEVAGVKPGKGLEIYRIDRQNMVEKLYSSDSETAYSLLVRNDGNLLAATGPKGRILSISPDRLVTLLLETPEEQVTDLVANGDKIYAATSNLGKVFDVHNKPSSPGHYESRVLDAGVTSRWGLIRWQSGSADSPVRLYTRSGNTGELDETWGDWKGPYQDHRGSPIESETARYLQIKLEFPAQGRSSSITSPGQFVEQVAVSYLQSNVAPQITSLTVHAPGKAFVPLPITSSGGVPPGGPDGAHARSLPLEMRNLNGPQPRPGSRAVFIPGSRSFSWQARDANDDDLTYSLLIRKQGEDTWNTLRENLTQDYLTLDGAAFADGTYTVKVTVSDRLSNPPGQALQSELVSKAFTISNLGPRLEISTPQATGRDASIQVTVQAGAAMLHQAEYQLDGGGWVIVLPEDGITDGHMEIYAVQLRKLPPGDRVFSMRVIDRVGNITTRRAVLRVR